MRAALALAAVVLAAGCAGPQSLVPGQSTAADVQAVMGSPAHRRSRPDGESWLYYPSQPFGRKVFVARLSPDGRLLAVEQRLSEEYVARLIPNHSRNDDVLDLFGPPYEAMTSPRMQREMWSWHMRQYANEPVGLHVQMSPDGVVREVYLLDESRSKDRSRDGVR